MAMMTELCQNLRNWFDRGQEKWQGKITINNGEISFTPNDYSASAFSLKENQYFRIIGSLFNDGVHVYNSEDELTDEEFEGSIWSMAVPPAVIELCDEIEQWNEKYGGVDGAIMSPYSSESFMGYSYTKSSVYGSRSSGSSTSVTWKDMFASRMNPWRKI